MAKQLRIALLIESSRGYGREILSGIAAYARAVGHWTFHHAERSLGDTLPSKLKDWSPDGIIARIEHPKLAQRLRRWRLPTVDLAHLYKSRWVPEVIPDQKAIVRLGVDHLLSLGLRHFAYCGFLGVTFSDERQRYFVEYLSSLGYPAHAFQPHGKAPARGLAAIEADAQQQVPQLAAWFRGLPKPVGLMACNDMRAYQVLNIRHELGIKVPDEVAVIGVDNDLIVCELSDLPLSSVDPNAREVGYKAAALLHRMIEGRGRFPKTTLVAPRGVVARRSTDVLAFADREMVEIVHYLREHACEGLTVGGLLQRSAVSHSKLCRWFADHLGHSPAEEIARTRVEHAKQLLAATNMRLEEIAWKCGFTHAETMYRLFKRMTGCTPGEYRRQQQYRLQLNPPSFRVTAARGLDRANRPIGVF